MTRRLRSSPRSGDTLSAAVFPSAPYTWNIRARNEGLTTQSRVQYVAKGANFLKLGYRYTGTMRVLETLLRYDYFWTRIRVQGGAYGCDDAVQPQRLYGVFLLP